MTEPTQLPTDPSEPSGPPPRPSHPIVEPPYATQLPTTPKRDRDDDKDDDKDRDRKDRERGPKPDNTLPEAPKPSHPITPTNPPTAGPKSKK